MLSAEGAYSAAEHLLTWNKGVFCTKSHALELFVGTELDPHEPPSRSDQRRAPHTAEPVNERGEAKGPVSDLQVVEATLEGWLYVEVLVEGQLYPLAGSSWKTGVSKSGQRAQQEVARSKPQAVALTAS